MKKNQNSRFALLSFFMLLSGCTSPTHSTLDYINQTNPDPQVVAAEQYLKDGYIHKFLVATALPGTNSAAQAGLAELKTHYAKRLRPELLKAEQLFENGSRQQAIEACDDLAAKTPDAVGLAALRARMTRVLSPEVAAAEALFEQNRTQEAIIACIDIARKNPSAEGLADLQSRITMRLARERMTQAEKRSEPASDLLAADAKRYGIVPDTYRQKKFVVGENSPTITPLTEMQKALMQPVDLELVDADVNAILAEIKKSTNINYIADSDIVSTKKITARFENTPLIEMLGYFDKNLDINFSVCSNLIWITQKEAPALGVPPMQTRVYRLRKGLVGSELGKQAQGKTLFKGPEERGSGRSQDDSKAENKANPGTIGLLESIERFVPQPEGADFLFNDKVHALIVKNTLENLVVVENLIEALDIRPLQILIEARFVTTKIGDLRELGIDWLFQKPPGDRTAMDDSDTIATLKTVQKNIADTLNSNSEGDYDWTDIITIGEQIKQMKPNDTFIEDSGQIAVGSAGSHGFYQTLLGTSGFQATLKALQSRDDTKTIIVPRVTTLNNREANFRFGKDVSYFEEVEASLMTSGGYNSESRDNATYDYDRPTVVEVGYALSVTPSVGADLSTINMVLRPEISNVEEWATYKLSNLGNSADKDDEASEDPSIKLPIIARQFIETEAVVRSGETIVLGGLVDTTKKKVESGTPFLSDLPLIGWLFKTEEKEEVNNNILIFVTATLISDIGEELIPLNDFERYGLAVPAGARVPDILKAP